MNPQTTPITFQNRGSQIRRTDRGPLLECWFYSRLMLRLTLCAILSVLSDSAVWRGSAVSQQSFPACLLHASKRDEAFKASLHSARSDMSIALVEHKPPARFGGPERS